MGNDELEQHITALQAALEKGDLDLALAELKACHLPQRMNGAQTSPRTLELVNRALAAAEKMRAMREDALQKLAKEAKARIAKLHEEIPPDAPSFAFRVAVPADQVLVASLMRELFDEVAPGPIAEESKALVDEDIRVALAADQVRIILAMLGDEPAGLIRVDVSYTFPTFRLRRDKRCGYIDQMFVKPVHRKQRLGRQLLQLCEEWLRAQGISHCMLHAAPNALNFYTRLAYQSTREMFKPL